MFNVASVLVQVHQLDADSAALKFVADRLSLYRRDVATSMCEISV